MTEEEKKILKKIKIALQLVSSFCPSDYGFNHECDGPCLDCWEAALYKVDLD